MYTWWHHISLTPTAIPIDTHAINRVDSSQYLRPITSLAISSMAGRRQLLIIYNADASVRGKLNYAYRKLSSSSAENPACAACDITHGGLSLKEVPNWTSAKKEIEGEGLEVVQWHRDEIEPRVKDWIREQGIRYPVVLARPSDQGKDDMQVVADSGELAQCAGDATKLVQILKEKNLFPGASTSSL